MEETDTNINLEQSNIQNCGASSYNYGMGRFFQRPTAFDCMQGGVGMGTTPYSYPSYAGDWGLVPGPYSHGFNFNRPIGINNPSSSGFFSSVPNSRDYSSNIPSLGGTSSAFSSTGLGAQGTMGPLCNTDPYRGQCDSPGSSCSSPTRNSSPCITTMEPVENLDCKNKGMYNLKLKGEDTSVDISSIFLRKATFVTSC